MSDLDLLEEDLEAGDLLRARTESQLRGEVRYLFERLRDAESVCEALLDERSEVPVTRSIDEVLDRWCDTRDNE